MSENEKEKVCLLHLFPAFRVVYCGEVCPVCQLVDGAKSCRRKLEGRLREAQNRVSDTRDGVLDLRDAIDDLLQKTL